MDMSCWSELDVVSREISAAQGRLKAANYSRNYGLVRVLEQIITDKTKRRARLLESITAQLVSKT
jgi:hypothetical protein